MILDVGYQNVVPAERVVAIVNSESSPTKREIAAARAANLLTDVTQGRKTRSVIILDNHRLVLSTLRPQTLVPRLNAALDRYSARVMEYGTTLLSEEESEEALDLEKDTGATDDFSDDLDDILG
jgi:regulator of extracellular matrix RemA (YlzA/DUF370 family)